MMVNLALVDQIIQDAAQPRLARHVGVTEAPARPAVRLARPGWLMRAKARVQAGAGQRRPASLASCCVSCCAPAA